MSRADENRLDEQQEKIQVQSDAMIGLLIDRGILPDTGIDNEKVREARKEKQKNTYHNTLMLLQHYRKIVWLFECFPKNVEYCKGTGKQHLRKSRKKQGAVRNII